MSRLGGILKFAHYLGISRYLRLFKKDKLTVLSLHRISPDADYFWPPITPCQFDQLVKYAARHYEVILFRDLPDLLPRKKNQRPLLVLSFDDGYYDFIEHAIPVLHKYKVPANHNLVNTCLTSNEVIWTQRLNFIFNYLLNSNSPGRFTIQGETFLLESYNGNWMGFYLAMYKKLLLLDRAARKQILEENEKGKDIRGTVRMMTWSEAASMLSENIEIGSHTYSHDVLSTIQDKELLQRESAGSRAELEEKLGIHIDVMSFPNGMANPADLPLFFEQYRYLLNVDDRCSLLQQINGETNLISRINIREDDPALMILRSELFYTKLKKTFHGSVQN